MTQHLRKPQRKWEECASECVSSAIRASPLELDQRANRNLNKNLLLYNPTTMNNALTSTFALRVSFPGDFHICSSIYSVSIHYLTETGAVVQRCCSSHPKNQQQQKSIQKRQFALIISSTSIARSKRPWHTTLLAFKMRERERERVISFV